MPRDPKRYLYDIKQAIGAIREFTTGKVLTDYQRELITRSAVERQVMIIGEAIRQLANIDQQTVTRISHYRRIIAFRNILIHEYTDIDDELVWETLETYLPLLCDDVSSLLHN